MEYMKKLIIKFHIYFQFNAFHFRSLYNNQLQNIPDFSAATGAWIYFDQIEVNGILREGYLPKRGEKVRNRNTN